MGIFGWNYPPGAANDPNAPWNQEPGPCAVCGKVEDDCICPECPTCGGVGDPTCYEQHGLILSPEQIASLAKAEQFWADEDRAENEYWAKFQELYPDSGE